MASGKTNGFGRFEPKIARKLNPAFIAT